MPEPSWSCSSCEMKTLRILTMRILKTSSFSSHHQNCNPCISSSLIPFPTEDNVECNVLVSCTSDKVSSYSHWMRNHCSLRVFQSDHVLRTSGISSQAAPDHDLVLQDHQGCYQSLHLRTQILPWPSVHVICHSSNRRDLSSQQAGTHECLASRGYQQGQVTCNQHALVSSVPEYQMRNQAISAISSPPHGR